MHKIMITYAVDFESYYDKDCSISVYGPRGYFSHPKFDAYMVSVVGDNGYEFCGHPKDFDWALLSGQRVLSHNASFDEGLYLYGVEQGWWPTTPYKEWLCTADLTAFLGRPRALKKAVKDVFDVELSKETRDNMKGLDWAEMTPEFKAEVIQYALDDSRWCLKIWQELESQWPDYERYYSAHTRKICRRGIPVDEKLIEQNAGKLRIALFEAQQSIPWRDSGALLSPAQAKKACREAGIIPPKSWAMGDEECESWLDQHAETFPWVYAVRSYRRINALLKKVEAFEKGTFDERYYGGLMYCGAHTKRFSGSGGNLNLQNLPRKEMFGVDLRGQIKAPEGSSFVVVDLSQIEVRTLCWLAKDLVTLNEIRNTDDMYEAFAIRFGLWRKERGSMKELNPSLRQTVKGMVLGCGYGASAKKYAMIMKCSLEEASKSVRLYQNKMKKVVELWRKFEREIKMSAKSGEYQIKLPSGNSMHYKSVSKTADSLVCTMVRNGKPMLVRPWYGMITENCSQSLARDIFCYHLRQIEEAGHKIILHVHDEVVIECADADVERTLAEVVALMRTPPPWIPDIPLDADGHAVKIYTK
jgi:DNA polymerase I-like protein with 3'-5' exonuclease and polymerase domains